MYPGIEDAIVSASTWEGTPAVSSSQVGEKDASVRRIEAKWSRSAILSDVSQPKERCKTFDWLARMSANTARGGAL